MSNNLTKRQSEILSIITDHLKDGDQSPSLTELMSYTGLATKRGVTFHLDALEKKGYITRNGGARGINLVKEQYTGFTKVPLLGYANAGEPLISAEEEYNGDVLVDEKILKRSRKVFGVELRGDSMDQKVLNGVTMFSGNYVIIAKDVEVKNDDVVLAIVDNCATVKLFKRDKNTVILYPSSSNPIHKPIYLDPSNENIIAGKVITVLNNPSR